MMFYNEMEPLYLETEALGARWEAGLLQARGECGSQINKTSNNRALQDILFLSKSLTST